MELKRWVTADVYQRNDEEFTEQRDFGVFLLASIGMV